MIYLKLFIEFFKTGLFAVGGGLATIPFLYEMADKYGWFSKSMLTDMIAVSESTPGPIGVNMATYVGFLAGLKEFGIFGALLGGVMTTIGLVTPSVIIILLIAKALDAYKNNKIVQSAFYSLRPAVAGLIAGVAWSLAQEIFVFGQDLKVSIVSVVIFAATLFGVFKLKKIHPILFILIGALLGVVFGL